jgi:O-antigen ligase
MGAFWIVLIYHFWHGLGRLERLATYIVLALSLYCVATSLRQSVYVALFVGVIGLCAGILLGTGRNRLKSLGPPVFAALVVLVLLSGSFNSLAPIPLFQREFGDLGAKVQRSIYTADDEEVGNSPSFAVLQREGALRAFSENPILGIGWGAFYRSDYSPTGHELHSSLWRFPAELGIVGVILYLALLGILFVRGVRLFLIARGTPFEMPALVTLVALLSYLVSHSYNRMFTDRPYWWMLVIFMAFDVYLEHAVVRHSRKVDAKVPPLPSPISNRPLAPAETNSQS